MLADAIVEVTETGSSLKANHLKDHRYHHGERDPSDRRQATLADPWKREKLDQIALMLRGAIDAQSQVGLMLNVKRADLETVLAVLPALNSPTVSQLSNSEWVAVNTIVEERVARDVIPRLKAARATGIVEYPLNKVVLSFEGLQAWVLALFPGLAPGMREGTEALQCNRRHQEKNPSGNSRSENRSSAPMQCDAPQLDEFGLAYLGTWKQRRMGPGSACVVGCIRISRSRKNGTIRVNRHFSMKYWKASTMK
jgi:ATP phosphoribosyltransferase-like protein